MKNYQLRSAFPCLVKWKGGEEFLEDGQALVFDEMEKLFVYPATGRRDDVSFVLDMNKPSSRVQIFEVDEKIIFYLPKNHVDETKVEEFLTVANKEIKFLIGTNTLEVTNGSVTKSYEILKPKKYELFSIDEFAVLKIVSFEGSQLLAFNVSSNQAEIIFADKIEILGNEIMAIKDGHEEKHLIDGENFSLVRGLDFQPRNPMVSGMAFLQNLKQGKYSEACNFVDGLLSPSPEKLKAYFGEVLDFFPIDSNRYLIIKKSGHDVVQLDLKESLICNIQILD